jgi:hypothetical protein
MQQEAKAGQTVGIGGEGSKRFQRLGIGRVPIALFEHRESGEIAV